jgi:SAM-dependent methyltransferase
LEELILNRRLKEQHDIYAKILGYVVHPHIPIRSPNLKVAEVGTGSGIWLLELAKTLPVTCEFVGYDMSPILFPPQSAWPQNLCFRTQSVLESFPEAELGTYDIVAVRFLQVMFNSTAEWETTLLNLVSLLKPGGWLQWVEVDLTTCRQFQISPGTSRAALQETVSSLLNTLDRQWKAIRTLAELCRLTGMIDVLEDVMLRIGSQSYV